MDRGNPMISRMAKDAEKHPYADQPLDYYDRPQQNQQYGQQQAYGQNPGYGQNQQYGQQADPAALNRMYQAPSATAQDTQRATLNDVIVKTLSMLGIIVVCGVLGWYVPILGLPAALIGFVLGMVNVFKRKVSPALIIAYAVAEGVLLGAVSGIYEARISGIVMASVVSTLVLFVGMLALYAKAGARVGPRMSMVVMVGLVAYLVFCLVNWGVALMTGTSMRDMTIPGTSIPWGLVIGLVVVVLGCVCLIMDFQNIDAALRAGVPRVESWRLAFGLIVTLVWLYVEILRLLSYIMPRD